MCCWPCFFCIYFLHFFFMKSLLNTTAAGSGLSVHHTSIPYLKNPTMCNHSEINFMFFFTFYYHVVDYSYRLNFLLVVYFLPFHSKGFACCIQCFFAFGVPGIWTPSENNAFVWITLLYTCRCCKGQRLIPAPDRWNQFWPYRFSFMLTFGELAGFRGCLWM